MYEQERQFGSCFKIQSRELEMDKFQKLHYILENINNTLKQHTPQQIRPKTPAH